MAANLRDPGSIPGGDPKRFQDSSNYVFYIVGECFSSAADTHLATDLTCKVSQLWAHIAAPVARKNPATGSKKIKSGSVSDQVGR